MNDQTQNWLVFLGVFGIGIFWYYYSGRYLADTATRIIRKLFKNNIRNNNQINWETIREHLQGNEALKMQIGKITPDERYIDFKNKFMRSLTDGEKSEFTKNILNDKLTAKHLLKVNKDGAIGVYDVNFVLGLFEIPPEKKESFSKLINEYLILDDKDTEDFVNQKDSKSLITNFGVCPKCVKKISQFARKCPYCTADLD